MPGFLHVNDESAFPRFANRGRTYVYVLPCRDADVLKVGFSRNPLERFRTLHARFFEFFDLDRGLLIEAAHLRDARRIERRFITTFADRRASAPLVVPRSAAGHTEWYRGIDPEATALARAVCESEALPLHAPLRGWLRECLEGWSDMLFDWSLHMLDLVEYERFNPPPGADGGVHEKALGRVLDTYAAVGVDVQPLVPRAVGRWYEARHALSFRAVRRASGGRS